MDFKAGFYFVFFNHTGHFISFWNWVFMQNLTFLRKLDLDDNQITRIPALPASLEELKINKNQLTVLTDHCFQGTTSICYRKKNTRQNLFKNPKQNIFPIFFFFLGVKNLLKLELKLNTLYEASVSPATFRPLQKLLELQLDNNRFRSLPLGLPSSLQVCFYTFVGTYRYIPWSEVPSVHFVKLQSQTS